MCQGFPTLICLVAIVTASLTTYWLWRLLPQFHYPTPSDLIPIMLWNIYHQRQLVSFECSCDLNVVYIFTRVRNERIAGRNESSQVLDLHTCWKRAISESVRSQLMLEQGNTFCTYLVCPMRFQLCNMRYSYGLTVINRLFFNPKWTIFHLYHNKNKTRLFTHFIRPTR